MGKISIDISIGGNTQRVNFTTATPQEESAVHPRLHNRVTHQPSGWLFGNNGTSSFVIGNGIT